MVEWEQIGGGGCPSGVGLCVCLSLGNGNGNVKVMTEGEECTRCRAVR